MAVIRADLARMREICEELSTEERRLNEVIQRTHRIRSDLTGNLSGREMDELAARLSGLTNRLNEKLRQLRSMRRTLEIVCETYAAYEARIRDGADSDGSGRIRRLRPGIVRPGGDRQSEERIREMF